MAPAARFLDGDPVLLSVTIDGPNALRLHFSVPFMGQAYPDAFWDIDSMTGGSWYQDAGDYIVIAPATLNPSGTWSFIDNVANIFFQGGGTWQGPYDGVYPQ